MFKIEFLIKKPPKTRVFLFFPKNHGFFQPCFDQTGLES
jgi:hypothetical protein